MAKRKMLVTLTLWVTDRADDLRKEELEGMGGEAEYGSKLEDLTEYMEQEEGRGWSEASPHPISGLIERALNADAVEEMIFEGSDCQCTISEVTAIEAKWIGFIEGERPADRKEG
jgi:hypothetical protein